MRAGASTRQGCRMHIYRRLRARLGYEPLSHQVIAACWLANSALNWRASALRLSLDPLTPPLRSARRDTGFPAVASLRAIKDWTGP